MGVAVHLEFQQWHRSIHQSVEKSQAICLADLDSFLCCCGLQGVCLGSSGAVRLVCFPKRITRYYNDHSVVRRDHNGSRTHAVCLVSLHPPRGYLSLLASARACRGTRSHLDFVLARFHTNSHVPKSIKTHNLVHLSSEIHPHESLCTSRDGYLAYRALTARPLALFAF